VRKRRAKSAKKWRKPKKEGTYCTKRAGHSREFTENRFDKDDAMKYSTAYGVYQSAKVQAQREDVMNGFGNNGGEEFLSYLQTGESMIIGKDNEWKKWYDNMSGRFVADPE